MGVNLNGSLYIFLWKKFEFDAMDPPINYIFNQKSLRQRVRKFCYESQADCIFQGSDVCGQKSVQQETDNLWAMSWAYETDTSWEICGVGVFFDSQASAFNYHWTEI